MRSASVLLLLTGLAIVAAATRADDGIARFTDQADIAGNVFVTDNCFPNNNTGFLNPSSAAADTGGDGDGFEVNPTNAFADGGTDPNYKAENIAGEADRHRYYDYSFSIHSSCVIAGIEVRLDWWLSSTAGSPSIGVELSWDGGTSWTTAKTDTTATTTEHTAVLGSSSDGWGRTWTVSELSNANFRARLTMNGAALDHFLDWVPVKVYYGP